MKHIMQVNVHRRRGVALIMAVIALILCTAISLSMTKTTLLRQARYSQRLMKAQARLIADSALDHARQQLTKSSDYTGEVWSVIANEQPGTATITVENADSSNVKVTIVARYPNTSTGAQITIDTLFTAPVDP